MSGSSIGNTSGAPAQQVAQAQALANKQAVENLAGEVIHTLQIQSAALDAMLGIGTFLTVDELFAFAEQQLKTSDTEIRNHMSDVSAKRSKAALIGQLAADVRGIKEKGVAEQAKKLDELVSAAKAAGLTDDELEGVLYLKSVADDRVTNENAQYKGQKLEQSTIEDSLKKLDQEAQDLTSSVDLSMIKIQSLVQQRNQTLTMVSNVMAALNEPAKNAISNMRGA